MDTVHSTQDTILKSFILYLINCTLGYEEERETDLNVDQFSWKLLV